MEEPIKVDDDRDDEEDEVQSEDVLSGRLLEKLMRVSLGKACRAHSELCHTLRK